MWQVGALGYDVAVIATESYPMVGRLKRAGPVDLICGSPSMVSITSPYFYVWEINRSVVLDT